MKNVFQKNDLEPVRVVLASDHRGKGKRLELKKVLEQGLIDLPKIEVIDIGTDSEEKVDALHFGAEAAKHVLQGRADAAILMCGSGVIITAGAFIAGMTRGVMAAQVNSAEQAARFRQHQNGRMIGLGADFLCDEEILDIAKIFLTSETEVGTEGKERYQRRLDEMHQFYLDTVKNAVKTA